ncbi:methionine aminopeptidase 1-like [Sycon ciliatum]|uniref:methionine aminopeptidase 1-like n=1 Tax=Sycon ciliatum TaxID=27933 RepID=UPI0020A90FAB|eukprot:scpid58749/ scgid10297/ Methionine aminopeptidase 1; Peptidase M 1
MDAICETVGCGKPSKLRCPTCVKLGIPGSFFCSQDCFKSSWKAHKGVHDMTASSKDQTPQEALLSSRKWSGFQFTGPLRPYPVSPYRPVPAHIPRPDYAETGEPISEQQAKRAGMIRVLNDEEIEGMRVVGKLARECLDVAARACEAGVTTDEVDRLMHEAAVERECYPSPLNYYNFPKSLCTSVNEVICHGIPDTRPLENGDLCNCDITVYHRGFHGDLNETLFVGDVDEKSRDLTKVAYECLMKGIDIVRPGTKFREIGNVIQAHASANGYSVVKSYCGHGINSLFHCAPNVPHYAGNKAVGVMKVGNTFTIEPMINAGSWRDVSWPDDWTAVTRDGKRSAQFEQTLLVTDTGCEILTRRRENDGLPWFMDKK